MKFFVTGITFIVLATSLVFCTHNKPKDNNYEDGEAFFKTKCLTCHNYKNHNSDGPSLFEMHFWNSEEFQRRISKAKSDSIHQLINVFTSAEETEKIVVYIRDFKTNIE